MGVSILKKITDINMILRLKPSEGCNLERQSVFPINSYSYKSRRSRRTGHFSDVACAFRIDSILFSKNLYSEFLTNFIKVRKLTNKMKILMRADTHYSIVVKGNDCDKPKYTFSQVRTYLNIFV